MYDKSIAANLSFAAIIIYSNIYSYLQKSHQEGIGEDKLLFTEGELDVDELVGLTYDYAASKLCVKHCIPFGQSLQLGSEHLLGL